MQFGSTQILAMLLLVIGAFADGCDRRDPGKDASASATAGKSEHAAAPNLPTPQAALEKYLDALDRNDVNAIRAVVVSDDTQQELAEMSGALIAAFRNITGALTAKFGDKRQDSVIDAFNNVLERLQKIRDSKLNISDDVATQDADPKLKLKRTVAGWQVVPWSGAGTAELTRTRNMYSAMTRAFNEVADEIRSGKRATATDALQAINTKITAAEEERLQRELREQKK